MNTSDTPDDSTAPAPQSLPLDSGEADLDLDLDDEYDTEPLPLLTSWPITHGIGPAADSAPEPLQPPGPTAQSAGSRLSDDLTQTRSTPAVRALTPFVLVTAVLAALGAVTAWLLLRPSQQPDSMAAARPSTATDAPGPTPGETRLMRLLPKGYSPTSCTATAAPPPAVAKVRCTRNHDPGGPATATYTLTSGKDSLRKVFDETVRGSNIVICPGNIQSPVLCPTGVSKPLRELRQ